MRQTIFLLTVGVLADSLVPESWWSRRPGMELARTHGSPPSSREDAQAQVQVKVGWDGATGLVETGERGPGDEQSERFPPEDALAAQEEKAAQENSVREDSVPENSVRDSDPSEGSQSPAEQSERQSEGSSVREEDLSAGEPSSQSPYKPSHAGVPPSAQRPASKPAASPPSSPESSPEKPSLAARALKLLPKLRSSSSSAKLTPRFEKHDAANPAGFCVLDSLGIPLCCRTKLSECWKSMAVGGCQGSIGIVGFKGGDKDYCFAVHSTPGTGVVPNTLRDEVKKDPSVHSPLYVVWDYFDPRNEKLHIQSDAGATSTLRGWTKWLKHICRPLFRWLNPPEDPDPQMLWCLQEGEHACEVKCRGQIKDLNREEDADNSGELLTPDEEKGNVKRPEEARPNPSPCQPFIVALSEHLEEDSHVPVLDADSAPDDYEPPKAEKRQYSDGHFYTKGEFFEMYPKDKQQAVQDWEKARIEQAEPTGDTRGAPLLVAALVLLS